MTATEQYQRSISARIGCTLLIFSALTLLRSGVLSFLPLLTASLSAVFAEILQELIGAALYILAFCLPLAVFKWISRGYFISEPKLSLSLDREGICCAFFGVAVTQALAFVNARLVDVFEYSEFSDRYLWNHATESNYQLILLFITLAVVPAFVEELLFRGLILENLLPCGKTVAIFGSAFLFGMMHGNAEQLLYATGAGLVFAWIYVRTRSIWTCILAHFINNFQSVFQIAVVQRLSPLRAQVAIYVVEGMLLLLGILSAILVLAQKHEGAAVADVRGEERASLYCSARCFFSVPIIIFVLWCVANMLMLILMAVI